MLLKAEICLVLKKSMRYAILFTSVEHVLEGRSMFLEHHSDVCSWIITCPRKG